MDREVVMAIKLHRCKNVWVKFGGHPCWKVQKALDDMGIQYEDEQAGRLERSDRCRSRSPVAGAPVERGELAEEVAGTERPHRLAVDRHLHLSLEHDVQVAAHLPLLDDRLSCDG